MDIDAGGLQVIAHDDKTALLLVLPAAALPPGPRTGACREVEAGWAPVEEPGRLVLDVVWRGARPGADHHVRFAFDLTDPGHGDAVDRLARHGGEVTLYLTGDLGSQRRAVDGLQTGDADLADRHILGACALDCRPLTLLDARH